MRILVACVSLLLACGCRPSNSIAPPYDLVGAPPHTTTLSADDVMLTAVDYCNENRIDLRFLPMPHISYDTLDGTGYWHVLYMGETHAVDSHFALMIDDSTGTVECLPGA